MGDCGAFSYKDDEIPPYTVEEVISFYEECGFDYGISVDHLILNYNVNFDDTEPPPQSIVDRQALTLEYASEFIKKTRKGKCRFEPLGVAQGWSPKSYTFAVRKLQSMGYTYIAIGGLVPMKTCDILATLEAANVFRRSQTRFHLLGVSRCENIISFRNFGAVSFDSTSPLVQAFKSDHDNYHTPTSTYIALRVPQIEANAKLKANILAGKIDQDDAIELEQECLRLLKRYDTGNCSIKIVLEKLLAYEKLHDGKLIRREAYLKVLQDRPWKTCRCAICVALGIHVMLFRGAERNRRRGFHNLQVFHNKVRKYRNSNHAGVKGKKHAQPKPATSNTICPL
jgi:queuine/archaeosine tRNA-ribosyltransferase